MGRGGARPRTRTCPRPVPAAPAATLAAPTASTPGQGPAPAATLAAPTASTPGQGPVSTPCPTTTQLAISSGGALDFITSVAPIPAHCEFCRKTIDLTKDLGRNGHSCPDCSLLFCCKKQFESQLKRHATTDSRLAGIRNSGWVELLCLAETCMVDVTGK